MKITVGHLVLAVGVGTFLVLGPLGGLRRLDKTEIPATREREATPLSEPARDLPSTPVNESRSALPFEERLPAGETALPDLKASDPPAPPAIPVAPLSAPKVSAPDENEGDGVKPVRRRRAKGRAASDEAAATPLRVSDDLIGTYVSLRLANGREVKGALVEKSATLYKIELPGLGAMSYPARDVVSVVPAQ